MAACLWKAARNVYCKLPYVECARIPPVKTCLDLWKAAMVGNVVAMCQFIVSTLFAPIDFVKYLFGLSYKPGPLPPPTEEDLYTWVWNGLVEYGTGGVMSIVVVVQTLLLSPAIWLLHTRFFQAVCFFIVLSLGTLKLFKEMRKRFSGSTEDESSPRDMNLNHLEKVPKTPPFITGNAEEISNSPENEPSPGT